MLNHSVYKLSVFKHQSEEATKNAFVLPFLQSLGNEVFNSLEFGNQVHN